MIEHMSSYNKQTGDPSIFPFIPFTKASTSAVHVGRALGSTGRWEQSSRSLGPKSKKFKSAVGGFELPFTKSIKDSPVWTDPQR